jgi:hypothetical protein
MRCPLARIYSEHYGFDMELTDNDSNEFVLFWNRDILPLETIEQIVFEATKIKIQVIGEMVWA